MDMSDYSYERAMEEMMMEQMEIIADNLELTDEEWDELFEGLDDWE